MIEYLINQFIEATWATLCDIAFVVMLLVWAAAWIVSHDDDE